MTGRSKAERGPAFITRPGEAVRILSQAERVAYVEELDDVLRQLWTSILEEITISCFSADITPEEGVLLLLRKPDSSVAIGFLMEEQLHDFFGANADAVRDLLRQNPPNWLSVVYVDGDANLHVASRPWS